MEMLPVLVAAALWGRKWKGLTVCSHCDNEAVVASIQGNYCKQPNMVHMLHCLFFFCKQSLSLCAWQSIFREWIIAWQMHYPETSWRFSTILLHRPGWTLPLFHRVWWRVW